MIKTIITIMTIALTTTSCTMYDVIGELVPKGSVVGYNTNECFEINHLCFDKKGVYTQNIEWEYNQWLCSCSWGDNNGFRR